ncbi:MAG TPA: hypothetical protein VIR54_16395, partial [Vicinamibacterales bacterium]
MEVAYHMAFTPEVLWGARLVQTRRDELGPVQAAHAWFTDPYATDIDAACRSRADQESMRSTSASRSVSRSTWCSEYGQIRQCLYVGIGVQEFGEQFTLFQRAVVDDRLAGATVQQGSHPMRGIGDAGQ